MDTTYYKEYSHCLQRDMEFKVYGRGGIPILAFPAQDGHCYDLENFGLLDTIGHLINSGKIQVFTCDTVDKESYSDEDGDIKHRTYIAEQYYYYIVDELVPRIRSINCSNQLIYTMGVSLGGMHAANMFFRRPDIFGGCISLSGYFDTDLFFGDYCDEYLYNNSPVKYLRDMPSDHPYINMYNDRKIILCCGQGAYEDEMNKSSHMVQDILNSKGVNAWIDFWGYDVNHDWNWWEKQLPYFMERVIGG